METVQTALWVVVLLVALALLFDFMNGFHDAANSIATVVSTGVLKPAQAVLFAAFFNFVAIFVFHLSVAATVASSPSRQGRPPADRSGDRQTELATLLKVLERLPPSSTTAMKATLRPYSTAVAPRSSLACRSLMWAFMASVFMWWPFPES